MGSAVIVGVTFGSDAMCDASACGGHL